MKEYKKQPILKTLIDSNIYLEKVLIGKQAIECSYFIDKLGYKNRNLGILSTIIVGEIFSGLFKRAKDSEAILKALDFLVPLLNQQLNDKKIIIKGFTKKDCKYVNRIKEVDSRIRDNDAMHLSFSIVKRCKYFITIDKELLNQITVKEIENKFNLKILHPSEF